VRVAIAPSVYVQNNPLGVAMVTFATPADADDAVKMLDYRWLRHRQLRAHQYDGETKYLVNETEEMRQQRIDQWHAYLEKSEDQVDEKVNKDDDDQEESGS
jgi:regulator of RNase E activity RraB